jgi:hypothetical protein
VCVAVPVIKGSKWNKMTYLGTKMNPCFFLEMDMALWQAYLASPTADTLTPHSRGSAG